ncbi:polysaccharide deacetylase family protein [Dactylosporangium sp. NBC_01737]|uniref:polysaccharide deacetylase family protein n=1 Tax=Dactylosporangium sp. NBC_01737 TaxID=2975959 RepID=UPI002E14E56A|nr:polysaccharide deacetylase family protein [Dactylosporangium sp. NBC_01737]
MRKLLTITSAALIGMGALLYHAPSGWAATNLIANPSVETAASATTPTAWQTGAWGTNATTFSYLNTGHSGTRSVKVQTTSYTSGDAKWYFTPVAVTPNATYTFSDYYQATVSTSLVVQFTTTGGGLSYIELTPAPATTGTAWGQTTQTFTAPANAQSVTVFHLLDKVGSLTIDDASLTAGATTPPPPAELVANSSVEVASATNPNQPNGWTSNNWGGNTAAFSYLTTGHSGSRSVKVTVTNYTDGDAKWYFTPVTVTPGVSYTFSDWYQSSVQTELIVQFTRPDGTVYYESLAVAAASSTWKQASFSVSIPADVSKLSVFHVIAANGSLTLDDASLTVAAPTPSNPIANPSVESANGSSPAAWSTGKWGSNTASFDYVGEGHTGSHSVKVTVSNYTDGDAKWMHQALPLEPNKQYRFSAWYKTNTQPHVVAQFNRSNGTAAYFGMPQPLPPANAATTWQKYSDTFTVPSDAASVSVFVFLTGNGWVQTDDYSLEPYTPTGFNRPLVSLTFDDGHESNATSALPLLQARNFKSTQCYMTEAIEGVPGAPENVLAFANAGHEICSHSITHPFLSQIPLAQLRSELTHSQQYLQQVSGQAVRNIASPYGDYNATVLDEVKKSYRSHRTVDEGFNSKDNFDIYRIRVQNIEIDTTLAELQSWLNQAKATNTWLVLVYHRVVPSGQTDGGQYDTNQADFEQQLNALQNSGLTVKTYNDALDEVTAQL